MKHISPGISTPIIASPTTASLIVLSSITISGSMNLSGSTQFIGDQTISPGTLFVDSSIRGNQVIVFQGGNQSDSMYLGNDAFNNSKAGLFSSNGDQVVATFEPGGGGYSYSNNTYNSDGFTYHQFSGSVNISGSVTADNLWYRYTLTNLPLNTAGTYTIVPVTPGYKFVPMKAAEPNSLYNTTCQLENNSDTNTVSISNFIRVGNALDANAIGKYTPGGGGTFLSPNQIIAGFDLVNGRSYMVSIDIYPIIVTVDGYVGDTNPIDITIAGYLKKI